MDNIETEEEGVGRKRPKGRWGHVYSALDLGTNNCRLLVAKPARDGFRVIDAFSRIVRLGEGVGTTGTLSEAAIRRTIEAIKICATKMRHQGVTRERNVATAACRRAANCNEFTERVEEETGIRLDIISSDEEARLALDGCTSLLDHNAKRALVFDIGGGSTELIWLDMEDPSGPRPLGLTSLDSGVVTLAERFGTGRIEPEVFDAMTAHVMDMITPFAEEHSEDTDYDDEDLQMLGTSGTVTTVAGVHLGLPRYDRSKVDGIWLSFDDVRQVSQRLAAMSYSERVAHPCIRRGRADLVVAGCAVLEAIIQIWPVGRVRVADRGVREGMLRGLVAAADAEADEQPPTLPS